MSDVVQEYRTLFPQYESFAARVEALLGDLLEDKGIRAHFLESRAKTPESLEEKLKRPGKNYGNQLSTVPDLAGVRIVLYYEDDVPRAGEVIRSEFEVLEVEGAHQPEGYSPDQFGYLSLHFIVRLNSIRASLPEWRNYEGFKAELQVRTVLQHSWAAVSHALQYKREGDVPRDLRRRLFRLAGLFELADEEFVAIRDSAASMRAATEEALRKDGGALPIDAPTLNQFFKDSQAIALMQQDLESIKYQFDGEDTYTGELVEACERLGIRTLSELEELAKNYRKSYFESIRKTHWMVDIPFVLFLALIDRFSKVFTAEDLVAEGWDREIAERVLHHAGKNLKD